MTGAVKVNARQIKRIKRIFEVLVLIFMAVTISAGMHADYGIDRIAYGKAQAAEGTWTVQQVGSRSMVVYECQIADGQGENPEVALLQTHWRSYEVLVDDTVIYGTGTGKTGPVHLFSLPAGKVLTIHFLDGDERTAGAIEQSQIYTGNRSGIVMMIIKENLYAAVFSMFAFLFGAASIIFGFYMKPAWPEEICCGLKCLGIYIFCAGVWVLTDSRLLLLLTQHTEVVELISFLAFFSLPLPLLGFTRGLMPDRNKMFCVLQDLAWVMLLLYMFNYLSEMVSTTILILMEHTLMTVTIISVLWSGVREVREKKNRKLFRVMSGYVIFSVCSIAAFLFFYQGNSFGYSISYVMGILGFVLMLSDAAGIAIYEQMQENANVEVYAKMAYLDLMTGLGNRTAFLRDKEADAGYKGTWAYIMVDANNLKKVNDSQGHQKGDELLQKIAECIKDAVREVGRGYRIGGDEFAVSLKNKSREETIACMDRIRKRLDEENQLSDIEISAAMGYAWTDQKKKDLDLLLEEADTAMYENKRQMKEESNKN